MIYKRLINSSAAILLLALTISAISIATKMEVGSKLPMSDIPFKNIDGKELTLKSEALENGLLVVFSCNTCPFVVGRKGFDGWEKQYNTLYDLSKTNKIGMVLVNSNEAKRDGDDSFEEMVKHAKEAKYKAPYIVDVDSKLADKMEAKTTPHVYLFNKNLELVYKGSIDNLWDTKREKLETYLKDAISSIGTGNKVELSSSSPKGCSIKRIK